ncbi:hypothetical protein NDU88_002306 [Pleurodeles waltl]|uniref:Uncharacterized protein n=1 Tax=Pleurodeles waltl TaxID=8319 RepID=A0AAV7KRU8_PLEWA|nr:hypothetical protein NDU88_002306 [Pleurodeles waltl]
MVAAFQRSSAALKPSARILPDRTGPKGPGGGSSGGQRTGLTQRRKGGKSGVDWEWAAEKHVLKYTGRIRRKHSHSRRSRAGERKERLETSQTPELQADTALDAALVATPAPFALAEETSITLD